MSECEVTLHSAKRTLGPATVPAIPRTDMQKWDYKQCAKEGSAATAARKKKYQERDRVVAKLRTARENILQSAANWIFSAAAKATAAKRMKLYNTELKSLFAYLHIPAVGTVMTGWICGHCMPSMGA